MKKLVLVALAASVAAPAMASRIVEKANFRDDYIRMASGWPLCGAVSLQLKPSERLRGVKVQVRATKWAMSMVPGNKQMIKKGHVSEWVDVPTEGLRVAFDHAGDQPSSHWRIYCQQLGGKDRRGTPVSCKEVIELVDSVNQKACVFGPLSPLSVPEDFSPLNMETGADYKD